MGNTAGIVPTGRDGEDSEFADEEAAAYMRALQAGDAEAMRRLGLNLDDDDDPPSKPVSQTEKDRQRFEQAKVDIKEGNYSTRIQALKTLGEFGPKSADLHEDIAACMDGNNAMVKIWAVNTLGQIGMKAGIHAEKVAKILEECNPKPGKDDALKKACAKALGKMGERGAHEAVKLIANDKPHDLRKIGCRCLADQGAAAWRYKKELADCLTDKVDDIRTTAAEALGKMGTGIAIEVLPLFKAEAWRHRKGAVQAIGCLGVQAREFIPRLVEMLNDEHKDVVIAALIAFGNIGEDADLIGPRIAALQEFQGLGAKFIQEAARECLPRIGRSDLLRESTQETPPNAPQTMPHGDSSQGTSGYSNFVAKIT